MKPVNIGVIGAGGIARYAHLPAYKQCQNANVVAIADVNETALAAAKEQFSIPNAFTDYRDLLAMDEIDAVSICTPNFLHKDPAIAALRAGKHVLVEKPLAMNAQEGQEIVDAAKETGKQCMVGFVTRFSIESQVLKRFIDNGDLGEIYYGRAQYLRRRGIPGWGVFGQKDKQGGGPLIDLGVHILDLSLWLMGNKKPVSVSGIATTKFGNRRDVVGLAGQWDVDTFTVEDFGAGWIRFEDNSVLLLESSFAINIQEQSVRQIQLMGDQGGATVEPLKIFKEQHGVLVDITPVYLLGKEARVFELENRGVMERVSRTPVETPNRVFNLEIDAFVEAVQNGTPVPIPVEDGLTVSKIIDALYKSSELGKEVEIR